MGSPVLDEDFVMILITLLPEAWDNYTSAYLGSSRNKPELQSHEIIAILLHEDQRCKGQSGSTINLGLQAKGKNKQGKGKDDSDEKKCYNCKKKGHIAKDCWAKGGGMEGKGLQGRRGPNRDRSNQAKEGNSSLNNLTYMAIAETIGNLKSNWYLDSSTTSHITNNWNAFMEFMATLATPVLGIRNLAMALRYGTISIKFKVNNKFVIHKLQHMLYIPEAPNCLSSTSRFDETRGKVIIQKGKCSLENKNGNTVRHRIL